MCGGYRRCDVCVVSIGDVCVVFIGDVLCVWCS